MHRGTQDVFATETLAILPKGRQSRQHIGPPLLVPTWENRDASERRLDAYVDKPGGPALRRLEQSCIIRVKTLPDDRPDKGRKLPQAGSCVHG
eukprot:3962585-Alexandrium_andersonii.AAC.1